MAKYSIVAPHLTKQELILKLKEVKGFWKVQQIMVILNALSKPQSAESIASFVNLSKHRITKIIQEYNREGAAYFDRQGQGGRKYGYMTLEEEKNFLMTCEQKAIEGKYTTVSDIQNAFEQKINKSVSKSTIYRLLKRHNWRKLAPRPSHPKKDEQKQEVFKKTSQKK